MTRKFNPSVSHYKLRLHSAERTTEWERYIYDEFISSIRDSDIRYYPNVDEVRDGLRKFYDLSPSMDLIIGAGSDRCNKYFFEIHRGKHIILSEPCFGMYDVYSNMMEMDTTKVPYQFGKFDVKNTIRSITKDSVVVLSNPSSPIGDVITKGDLIKILMCGVPVLVDEAYIEFSDEESSIQLINRFPNLYVTRTLSKALGSAGVRVGVIVSNKSNIDKISQFRDMYEISGLSLRWTQVVINNKQSVTNYINQIKSTKKELVDLLVKNGYEVFDGECNWVHIRKDSTIKLPNNIVFRTECEIPGDYNSDWIRLQISTDINDYKFLF